MSKTIENKEISLFISEGVKLKYSDLLTAIVNKPIKEGITLKQMKADLALLAKFENIEVGELIEVSDEELKQIKELTESHLWGLRHVDFEVFGDYIDNL